MPRFLKTQLNLRGIRAHMILQKNTDLILETLYHTDNF